MRYRILPLLRLALLVLATAPALAAATDDDKVSTEADNLLVVLRESRGSNKQDEALQPYGKLNARLDDGSRIEIETSWYQYLGDMHVRLVFEGPGSLQSASPQDLARLRLDPQQALQLAIDNLRRRYGQPAAQPWSAGLMQVQGGAPDLNSSYFLDRAFWQQQQARHPEGLVVAVPRRGGLVYAPLSDTGAVDSLRFSATALYHSSERTRVSSALYLFKDNRWSVFQPPMAP